MYWQESYPLLCDLLSLTTPHPNFSLSLSLKKKKEEEEEEEEKKKMQILPGEGTLK